MSLKSILLQLVVGLAVTVIGAFIVEKISSNSSDEPPQDKSANRPDNSPPPNSRDIQSGRQNPSTSTSPNTQNYYPKPKPVEENYSSYINPKSKADVSIIILDASGNISNPSSSDIAEVYQKAGKSTSVGLIKSAFIRKPEFQELCDGNSEVIQKLNLGSYADYLAIGRINFAHRPGKLVDGTTVCSASLSMSIISTSSQSLKKSFTISNANGNGADESQAKADAIQKLLDRYYNQYSSL